MEVYEVNNNYFKRCEDFLSSIEGITLDKDVILNASILMDKDEIIGTMSFEVFGNIGLIRYFVFKKVIDEQTLIRLFSSIVKKAAHKKIELILSFIENKDVIPIFEFLGFFPVDNKYVYIGEKKFTDTKNKNAEVYCYKV